MKLLTAADHARINRMLGGFTGLLILEYGATAVYEAIQALANNEPLWKVLANNVAAIGEMAREATTELTGEDPGPLPPTSSNPEGK